MKRHILGCTITSALIIFSHVSQAENSQTFPLQPRVNGTLTYSNKNSNGQLDALIPFFGHQDGYIYTDVNATYASDKSWMGALGLGARQIMPNGQFLVGGYGFIERLQTVDNTDDRNRWTYFNPGIEAMTNHWDGRINAYIPVGPREQNSPQSVLFGDQLPAGTVSFQQYFEQHTQYDQLFAVTKNYNIPWGMDADVGYTFTNYKYTRVHGGGYYFRYPVSEAESIRGVEGGVEVPLNQYVTFIFNDTYDKVTKNTGMASLRFTLGGINKSVIHPVLRERMLDPIYRHLSALPVNTFVQTQVMDNGQLSVENQHLWFFTESGGSSFNASNGLANCTYENPCNGSQFTQSNASSINGIDPGTKYYFSPGSYSLGGTFNLPQGQAMYGRSSDYFLPASSGSGFPTFTGSLDLAGNNTLDSIALTNSSGTAISITAANNIVINNIQIEGAFARGIDLDNAQNILIENSVIGATNNGITVANQSTATIQGNTINVSGNSGVDLISGIDVLDQSVVTFNDNTVNISSSPAPFNGTPGATSILGTAIYLSGNGELTGSNNTFEVTGNNPLAGIWNLGGILTLSSSTFNISNTNSTNGYAIGIESDDSGAITTVNNSTFNLSVDSVGTGQVFGVENSQGTVNITNNIFNFTAPGGTPKTCISGAGTTNNSGNSFNISC